MNWLSFVVLGLTVLLGIFAPASVTGPNAFFGHLAVGPVGARTAVVTLLVVVASGVLNGAFYNRQRHTWIHPVQLAEMFFILLLFFMATANAVAAIGIALFSNVLFQAGINSVGFDRPLVWTGEAATYDVAGHKVPKEFYGWGRYVQLVVGAFWVVMGLTDGRFLT